MTQNAYLAKTLGARKGILMKIEKRWIVLVAVYVIMRMAQYTKAISVKMGGAVDNHAEAYRYIR